MDRVEQRLAEVAAVLPAIREFTFAITKDAVVSAKGTLMLGHAPSIAPEAYHVSIYPAAPEDWLRSLESAMNVSIPAELRQVLRVMNGCHCFDLSLFGVTSSPADPHDRRGEPVALRLATALEHWADEYGRAGSFYFGGAPWTYDENVGYFWSEDGPYSARTSGQVVGKWASVNQLFEAELARLTGHQARVH